MILEYGEELRVDFKEVARTEFPTQQEQPLFFPWLAYVYELASGDTLAEKFLAARRHTLGKVALQWVEAQVGSWMSVWSCTDVQPPMVSVTDLLTGEKRIVHEVAASATLRPGHCVLARVVDLDGKSLFAGMHSRPLLPLDADDVIAIARKRLKLKARISVDEARQYSLARKLLTEWDCRVEELLNAPRAGVVDKKGHRLLFIDEVYDIVGERDEVLQLLRDAGLYESQPETFVYLGRGVARKNGTLPVNIEVGEHEVTARSMTLARAEAGRKFVDKLFPTQLKWRLRTIDDPESDEFGAKATEKAGSSGDPEEAAAIAEVSRIMKKKYYDQWLDEAIPALGGETPREAVRTLAGKDRVRRLLEGLALFESQEPEAKRYDTAALYKALGLRRPR